MTMALPDPVAVNTGALKSAYLSACLLLEEVPTTPMSKQVRREVLEALQTPGEQPLPTGPSVKAATPFRVTTTINTEILTRVKPIVMVELKGRDQETGWAVILGGSIGVWWPFENELIPVVVEHQARRDRASAPAP
ncbi:hypothetical protein [Luteococcus sp. OSA5]|uniref:hypothetical protein n=1 Tax=Luteococcus sp. OSA5 TaxID=3401630 RepID=UPI003B42FB12